MLCCAVHLYMSGFNLLQTVPPVVLQTDVGNAVQQVSTHADDQLQTDSQDTIVRQLHEWQTC